MQQFGVYVHQYHINLVGSSKLEQTPVHLFYQFTIREQPK